MYVFDVERVEPASARLRKGTVSEELADQISRARTNNNAIIYGTFHKYKVDEREV